MIDFVAGKFVCKNCGWEGWELSSIYDEDGEFIGRGCPACGSGIEKIELEDRNSFNGLL